MDNINQRVSAIEDKLKISNFSNNDSYKVIHPAGRDSYDIDEASVSDLSVVYSKRRMSQAPGTKLPPISISKNYTDVGSKISEQDYEDEKSSISDTIISKPLNNNETVSNEPDNEGEILQQKLPKSSFRNKQNSDV